MILFANAAWDVVLVMVLGGVVGYLTAAAVELGLDSWYTRLRRRLRALRRPQA